MYLQKFGTSLHVWRRRCFGDDFSVFQICALCGSLLRVPGGIESFNLLTLLPPMCQGLQLERALQKIVFRLDSIDENLQSHALLKQMRALNANLKAPQTSDAVSLHTKCVNLPIVRPHLFLMQSQMSRTKIGCAFSTSECRL